jgi:outer membrane immunogenic protein
MKSLFLAASALLVASPAFAQETAAAASAAPAANDDGFYAGVHLGYSSTRPHYQEPEYPDYARNPAIDGVTGGILAGYRTMVSPSVSVGIEADFGLSGADVGAKDDATNNDYIAFDQEWTAHVRAKLGYAVRPGTTLFLAGGLALTRLEANYEPDYSENDASDFRKTYRGWSLGAGVEQRISDRLGVRLEYLHDQFSSRKGNQYFGGTPDWEIRLNPNTETVRAALTYGF